MDTGKLIISRSGNEGDVRMVITRLNDSEDIDEIPTAFDYYILLKTSMAMYEYNKKQREALIKYNSEMMIACYEEKCKKIKGESPILNH
ncbi:hypothetical protein [Bacillus sp. FJAT-50079]|uniref:hypothetical protein n=1 Tax=Bacillus sp. FJAT-50079 TaxID=2833577 RepID=UPI001BC8EA69|nr:hypothetical protein [Bacillus sp. FJAT-50079]MBS4209927.1 hypothetical protein [Bacillus sp. FJAT-50079]